MTDGKSDALAQERQFCRSCAQDILLPWRGWGHLDVVPWLPRIVDGACEDCGADRSISSTRIVWVAFHEEFNTGLPNYWLLYMQGTMVRASYLTEDQVLSNATKWGLPYYGFGKCPRCGDEMVLSQFTGGPFPGENIRNNCRRCDVGSSRATGRGGRGTRLR